MNWATQHFKLLEGMHALLVKGTKLIQIVQFPLLYQHLINGSGWLRLPNITGCNTYIADFMWSFPLAGHNLGWPQLKSILEQYGEICVQSFSVVSGERTELLGGFFNSKPFLKLTRLSTY